MQRDDLMQKIESLAPGTQVQIWDLHGDGRHYRAKVVSTAFVGLKPIERHRKVFAAVKSELDSGELHALNLETLTPEESK